MRESKAANLLVHLRCSRSSSEIRKSYHSIISRFDLSIIYALDAKEEQIKTKVRHKKITISLRAGLKIVCSAQKPSGLSAEHCSRISCLLHSNDKTEIKVNYFWPIKLIYYLHAPHHNCKTRGKLISSVLQILRVAAVLSLAMCSSAFLTSIGRLRSRFF